MVELRVDDRVERGTESNERGEALLALQEGRTLIDGARTDVLVAVSAWLSVSRGLAQVKDALGYIDPEDKAREKELDRDSKALAEELGLPPKIVEEILGIILRYSKEVQSAELYAIWQRQREERGLDNLVVSGQTT